MQVNTNTQTNYNPLSFKQLKHSTGLACLNGVNILDQLENKLIANEFFKDLCKKYDVFIHAEDRTLPIGYKLHNGIYPELVSAYGLSLKIFAQRIKNNQFPWLDNNNNKMLVGKFFEPINNMGMLQSTIDNIDTKYISNEEGMKCDFIKFMTIMAKNYN